MALDFSKLHEKSGTGSGTYQSFDSGRPVSVSILGILQKWR